MKRPCLLNSWSLAVCPSVVLAAALCWWLAAGAVSAVEKPVAAAKTTNAPAPVLAEVEIPRSVFLIDPKMGRDPFFPARHVTEKSANTDSAPQVARFPQGVEIKGISGQPGRWLIIINDQTFQEGEKSQLKVGSRRVPIHVVAIKENSAVLTINGQTQDIVFRSKLF